uniref:Uncharacterized protein n=1 Tax=Avena sativa TaxID=4498 RepID=A0ACD5XV84_AVESA
MIHSKKLVQLTKKWQRMVVVGGKQTADTDGCCSTASVADRGHCVMYTADGSRFKVPLVYLATMLFSELLRISQEEFGFSSHGRITLPFDASVMEYMMCLIRREASKEVGKAFLSSIARPCHSHAPDPLSMSVWQHIKEGDTTMVSAKRLSQMIKKWQRMAAIGRKRLMGTAAKEVNECCSSVAVKGHCAMYTADGRRFEVPLVYLSTTIIGELLRMSQDEFGFTSDERITLPCDAPVMEYVMCLLRRNASEEVERAFLSSVVRPCHYGNGFEPSMGVSQQVVISSF